MAPILLFILAAWLVLSLLGLIIEGLFWLFVVGVVLFLVTAGVGYFRRSSQ